MIKDKLSAFNKLFAGHKVYLALNLLKKILFVAMAVSFVYVGTSIFLFSKQTFNENALDLNSREGSQALLAKEDVDYSPFLEKAEKEKIFGASSRQKTSLASKASKGKIDKVIENLRLVGIISKDPPRAMIEDGKTNKTFYLKKGEKFLKGITVEEITENSVMLNYYGEDFEIYL